MNKNKVYLYTLGILGAGLMASCTNELDIPTGGGMNEGSAPVANIVHAPDFYAYSGGEEITSSVAGTRAGTHGYSKVQDNPSAHPKAPAYVTNDEWEYVKSYLIDHPDEGYTSCPLYNYYIQWAGKSYATYTAMDNNNAAHYITGSNQMDYIEIDGVHLNDYNGGSGPMALCTDWPLSNPTYHDSYHNLTVSDKYRFYYIPYNGKLGLYLCFDYYTKGQNGNHDGDGIYNDWVLKISPADGSDVIVGGAEEDDTPGTNPPANTPGNDDNGDSGNGGPIVHNSEVEVNLSVNDVHRYPDGKQKYDNADLWTKLSIHVRTGGDVRVVMPLPTVYLCESDDLVIFQGHEIDFTLPADQSNHSVSYDIDGKFNVTLTVSFETQGSDGLYPGGQITVTTNGITKELIDYLFAKNGDGINFEVWNYFQTETADWVDGVKDNIVTGVLNEYDYERFQGYLNNSTVEFLGAEYPSYYINAFGAIDKDEVTGIGTKTPNDCQVKPASGNVKDYSKYKENMFHLNGSSYNVIYYQAGVEADDAHLH